MINKEGQYKTRLPTQYRTTSNKSKKKVLKKEGDKYNFSIERCPVCGKKKMEKYDVRDSTNSLAMITMRKCKNCNFINGSSVFYHPPEEPTYHITWYKPSGSLEDKSEKK